MSKIRENKERAEEIRKCIQIALNLKNDFHYLQTVHPDKIKELREQLERAQEILTKLLKCLLKRMYKS